MKVASVSSVYYRPQCRKGALKQHSDENSGVVQKDVSFKGNFGKIVGGTLGTGAVGCGFLLCGTRNNLSGRCRAGGRYGCR